MFRLYLKGTGIMVGMIVGAGVFALPYAFAKAGVFWGVLHFTAAFIILLFLHQWYGEVAFYTKGRHRLTGYVEIFLGKKMKVLAFLTTLGAYYGSLLAYGVLGGLFLANIFNFFGGYSPFIFSIAIFIIGGCLAFLNFRRIAEINFYLTIPIFGFIAYLLAIAWPHLKTDNLFPPSGLFANGNWFLPYGIWLFALSGFAALPETRDICSGFSIKNFKRIIWISLLASAVFYFIFVFAVLGVNGILTTEDALSGISAVLGAKALLLGSIIGFLAVFTSYIVLAADLKNIFKYDYKISSLPSWIAAIVPPAIIFLTGADGLVFILGLIGTFGIGILGVFIIFMRRKMAVMLKSGERDGILKPIDGNKIKIYSIFEWVVLAGIISAVVYDIYKISDRFI